MEARSPRVGRQKILETAEALFIERGYRAVSIREIAQACAVTNAALYYHFPSKEALFREVMKQHAAHLNARMKQAAQKTGSARQNVEAILAEYARLAADHRSPLFLLRRESGTHEKAQFHEEFGRLMQAMLQPLEDALCQAARQGELRDLPEGYSPAAILVGMLHGVFQHRQACIADAIQPQDVKLVMDIFWRGLHQA